MWEFEEHSASTYNHFPQEPIRQCKLFLQCNKDMGDDDFQSFKTWLLPEAIPEQLHPRAINRCPIYLSSHFYSIAIITVTHESIYMRRKTKRVFTLHCVV